MKDTLELKFQLLMRSTTTRPNFVPRSRSGLRNIPEDGRRAAANRSWSLMIQQMLRQMANPPEHQQEIGLPELLQAAHQPRSRHAVEADSWQAVRRHREDQMAGFAGTVLITERNKACFKVLDKEIADGKKNLGIFYGAGHMTDMEKRLTDLGFTKTHTPQQGRRTGTSPATARQRTPTIGHRRRRIRRKTPAKMPTASFILSTSLTTWPRLTEAAFRLCRGSRDMGFSSPCRAISGVGAGLSLSLLRLELT